MKKIITILILLSLIFSFNTSYAQEVGGPSKPTSEIGGPSKPIVPAKKPTQNYQRLENPIKVDSIEAVILLAVDIAIYIGVAFAILAIIFVGFKFVYARGKPEEISKAREWLMWIIIGLAVLISARVMVEIVKNTLIESGVVNENVFKKP